jgi:DNA replication protein DnaD
MVQKERDWRYIGGVIKTLRSRNITSLEQAREWDEERPDQTGHEQEWIEGNQKHNDMLKRIREDGL